MIIMTYPEGSKIIGNRVGRCTIVKCTKSTYHIVFDNPRRLDTFDKEAIHQWVELDEGRVILPFKLYTDAINN